MTRLSRQLSVVTAWALPAWSAGPGRGDDLFVAMVTAGYEGVQVFAPDQAEAALAAGLGQVSGMGTARTLAEVDTTVAPWAGSPATSVTLHLGTGFESVDEGRALAAAALDAGRRHDVAVLVETHRATVFQDPARALALVAELPDLRFTADLSHWYTGVELVYGDVEAKLAALEPVFERSRMIHGRISDPGCIQVAVAVGDEADHVDHFRRMWAAVRAGCERAGVDELPFVVELLPAAAHYARTVDRGSGPEEEVDRWTQADVLWAIASDVTAERAVDAGGHAPMTELPDLDAPIAVDPTLVDGFARDGHALVTGLASAAEVAAYRPLIEQAALDHAWDKRDLTERDTYGKAFLQSFNLWRRDPDIARFVRSRRFAAAAAGLLGVEHVRLYHDQALCKEPGGGHTPWHQDQGYWPLDTDRTITMWMPLADIAPEVGSMTFASGSHRLGDLAAGVIGDESHADLGASIEREGLVTTTHGALRAGDATFHAGWTVHSAGPNPSDRLRSVMTVIYVADGTRVLREPSEVQDFDRQVWLGGTDPGELVANDDLNPILF